MQLSSLFLTNFRNYLSKEIEFTNQTTIFIGKNGIGKTNILEAIYLIATGSSFRSGYDQEIIHFDNEFAKAEATILKDRLQVLLTKGVYMGKKTSKKRFLVNDVGRRKKDFIQNLKVVLFEPQDLLIILGTPSFRRKLLDNLLTQIDWKYTQALLNYRKGLKQRNKLLFSIREGIALVDQLEFWDQYLLKNGQIITQYRKDFLSYLNNVANQNIFLSSIYDQYDFDKNQVIFRFEYDHSYITEKRLSKYQQAEIGSAKTLIGPHRDDVIINFKIDKDYKNIANFGSRGQQRLGILALKLGEAEYLREKTNYKPIILLDDIFSELDEVNDLIVMNLIEKYQTIITATEIGDLTKFDDVEIIKL